MSSSSRTVRLLAPRAGVVVLAGLAGSGKTELLWQLAAEGEQVLDLEGMASHRGSGFGGIGQPPQPSHRAFVRAVRAARAAADPSARLWLEDEGPFIGRVGLPPELAEEISRAPAIELVAPLEARVRRLADTYGGDLPALEAALERSRSRLGAERLAAALAALRAGEVERAVRIVLPAYDAAYAHRVAQLGRPVLGRVTTGGTGCPQPAAQPRPRA